MCTFLLYKYFVRRSIGQATKGKRASLLIDVVILIKSLDCNNKTDKTCFVTRKSWEDYYTMMIQSMIELQEKDSFIHDKSDTYLCCFVLIIVLCSFIGILACFAHGAQIPPPFPPLFFTYSSPCLTLQGPN